jgi:hypothetical protein
MSALVFGGVYGVLGLVGFFVTGFSGSGTLVVFDLNVLDNVVHLALGAAGIAAFATGPKTSRMFAEVAGPALGIIAIVGIALTNPLGLLPIGGADVVLHAASALVLIYVGFAGTIAERPPA